MSRGLRKLPMSGVSDGRASSPAAGAETRPRVEAAEAAAALSCWAAAPAMAAVMTASRACASLRGPSPPAVAFVAERGASASDPESLLSSRTTRAALSPSEPRPLPLSSSLAS